MIACKCFFFLIGLAHKVVYSQSDDEVDIKPLHKRSNLKDYKKQGAEPLLKDEEDESS